jgi:hypothetical protein
VGAEKLILLPRIFLREGWDFPTFKNGKAAPARAAVFRFGSIFQDQPM